MCRLYVFYLRKVKTFLWNKFNPEIAMGHIFGRPCTLVFPNGKQQYYSCCKENISKSLHCHKGRDVTFEKPSRRYWEREMAWYTQANVRCSYDRDLPTLYQRLSQTYSGCESTGMCMWSFCNCMILREQWSTTDRYLPFPLPYVLIRLIFEQVPRFAVHIYVDARNVEKFQT